MIHLSYLVILEFFAGLILWWIAVYLIVQNPFSRLIQLLAGIFTAISFYLSSDILFIMANDTGQYSLNGPLLKGFIWSLYLPAPFLYHVSYLLIPKNIRRGWQKIVLYLVYIATAVIIFLEIGTNLTRDYSIISSPTFNGDLTEATGRYFWLIGVFFLSIFLATTINFYILVKKEVKFSQNWFKYFWPFIGMVGTLILGPLVLLSFYNLVPHPYFLSSFTMIIIALPLAYSILKYDLLIEEARIVFGKTFFYSSLTIFAIVALYFILLLSMGSFPTVKSLAIPFAFAYLIVLTHPAYDWFSTFVRDLLYNISSGISLVNDAEVYNAVKNYNNPEILENSTLLRLQLVSNNVRMTDAKTPVDGLKNVVEESMEYFKPKEDPNKRTKQNLKYHLLKMLAFDQAEEGQMLWELGFEEYPVRIMSQESEGRGPLFKSTSASDYTYTSRNSFIALKKEAIHNVAWRISYLEKLDKKKNL